MAEELDRKAFTRRRFLRHAAALGALPGIASIVAACGGDGGEAAPPPPPAEEPPPGEPPPAEPPPAEPPPAEPPPAEPPPAASGGVLRATMGSDVRGFDVQRFYDNQSVTFGEAIYSKLVTTDPQNAGTILPDLAEEVPAPENGGTSYTFRLRDATFHDGSPVTAADVKFSFERLIHPETKSEGGFYYQGVIVDTEGVVAGEATESSGIVVVDDKTVRFDLVEPRANFLNLLAIWFASIYPKAAVEAKGDAWNLEPIGSGPFKLDSYQAGQRITLSRYDGYFAADQIFLDGMEIDLAVDPDTAILRIDSGDADVMWDEIPSSAYNAIKNDPERSPRIVEGLVDNVWYLTLNSVDASAIFKTVDVRRAISMAINKAAILQHDQNRGEVADGFWSPASQYYDAEFPAIPYDPEQARSIIEAAGVAGQELDLIVPAPGTFFPTDGWAPLIQQDLQQAGLQVNIVSLAFDAWLNRTMDPLAIVPNGWSMDVPHGSYVIDSAFTTTTKDVALKDDAEGVTPATCCNFSRYATPEIDELNRIGNTTTDKQEEISAYQEIMRKLMAEEALWVTVYWPKRSLYRGDNVQNLAVGTNTAATLFTKLALSA
jgi:ABC-type transport system substrate-binding protein